MATAVTAAVPELTVSHLTCEGTVDAALVDTASPRFSWWLVDPARGARQSAYQLSITPLGADGRPAGGTIETRRTDSDQSQWVTVSRFAAQPKTRYSWQVRVWDEGGRDSGWSTPATFETGLLGGGWPAPWVASGVTVPKAATLGARYFRQEFTVAKAPAKARLFLAAFGLVEPWLNGRKVTEDLFLPGWPDYRKHVYYVTYDVTAQVQAGPNALGLALGDGWYTNTLMRGAQVGPEGLVSAWIELTDPAGKVTVVKTGQETRWKEGPVTEQGIYYGETYDARRDDPRWSAAQISGPAIDWHPAQVESIPPAIEVMARISPPVRRTEELKPVSRREVKPGVFLYDLGQNMVGWVRLKVTAPAGREVKVRMGEMLEGDGQLYTANLRAAHATATYIAAGTGVETWEPRFTYFGFRYVELSGADAPTDDAITGVVIHSDMPRIGYFECSNPLLNQLYANTLWGEKGNFLEVPTDCPQRDERLGWTGDAQVFSHTASYNYATGGFYRQWLFALRDSFRDDPGGKSGYSDIAPDIDGDHGSAGWADAGVIVPYVTWLHTGDRRVLEENFDTIQRWVEAQTRDYPDGIRRSRKSYGDWLAPGFGPADAPTPYGLIATAYYAHVTDLAGRIAAELGRPEAERDRALFAHVRAAFQHEFITPDGRITSDEQTAYLLALGFDLMPDNLHDAAVANLVRKFAEKDNHLATGFLGTPLITSVLTASGHTDLAYQVLLQETYPGWLVSVKNGATTVWERWDSWTPEHGFNSVGMNSFNHYAYGSVVGWFYDTIAGLKPDAAGAGWKHFEVAPHPGGGLTHAKATLETPYGPAASDWRIADGRFELAVSIPPNTTAHVVLPVGTSDGVTEGGRPLSELAGSADLRSPEGRVALTLPAGDYHFSAPAPK